MGQYKRKLKKGERWFYSGQHDGIKYHSKAIYLSKAKCRQAEGERLNELDKEQGVISYTLHILCTKRLDFLATTKSDQYYKDNKRLFKKIFSEWGDVDIADITRAMCHKFFLKEARRLKKINKTNASINSDLRYLRALFNYAINELEVLEVNPTRRLKFFPIDKKLKYIPPESDMIAVCEISQPHQQKLMNFVKITGCRISEAIRATGEDIDLNMDLLTLWTRKKKNSDLTPRRIPLAESLASYKKEGKLFPEWCQYPRFLEKYCDELNIKHFGWHAFRHRKASIMASQGLPLVEIMYILGHDNIEVTQQYLRLLGFTKY